LRTPVDRLLRSGARSARVICELLIKEHGAPDSRFLTNKPHIYYAVCLYIEKTNPDARIEKEGNDDRTYALAD